MWTPVQLLFRHLCLIQIEFGMWNIERSHSVARWLSTTALIQLFNSTPQLEVLILNFSSGAYKLLDGPKTSEYAFVTCMGWPRLKSQDIVAHKSEIRR
jgi:hypothetical protein